MSDLLTDAERTLVEHIRKAHQSHGPAVRDYNVEVLLKIVDRVSQRMATGGRVEGPGPPLLDGSSVVPRKEGG